MATVVALLTGLLGTPFAARAGPDAIADFTAPDLSGKSTKFSEIKGKKVTIVNFWASWCFPCRYEMPHLQRIHDAFAARGLTVVAIAVDDELAPVEKFWRRYGFTFPVLFDPLGRTKAHFGALGVPETYIVGADGRLVGLEDPSTGEISTMINDPTVWESPAVQEFLSSLLDP